MAHRDRSPVHVPLRTSSANPLRNVTMMDTTEEDVRVIQRKTSKASRILGTDIPFHYDHGSWNETRKVASRPSYLSPPDNTSRKNNFAPSTKDAGPPPSLRVRASSPLLGQEFRAYEPTPPLPKPSKKVHQSGSSSTLFSSFRSKEKDTSSKSAPGSSQGLQPTVRNQRQAEPEVSYQQPQASTKESKRKKRPSRLDLSLLFPKPRNPAPPLLSPQRQTKSPSPVSVVSDYSAVKSHRGGSNSGGRRLADAPPPRASVIKNEAPKRTGDSDLSSIAEKKDGEWLDQTFERTVGTSEIDVALDRYTARRSMFSRSSMYSNSHEQLRSGQRTPEPGRNSALAHTKDAHLTPNSRVMNPKLETSRRDGLDYERSEKSSITKRSSKSTLKYKNLQDSSVLSLSSSEDEEDEHDTPTTEHRRYEFKTNSNRNSVATYGDYEPEIYTASTAQVALSPTLRQVERAPSISSHGSHQTPRNHSTCRNPSTSSSASKLSNTTRRTQRSNGIPTIAEPALRNRYSQQSLLSPQELQEMNRRSRVIAVTRQEQDLLEAMRQRKGKITPSIVNFNADGEPGDRSSVVSTQTRDSFPGSDTSFLRLSHVFPPFHARADEGATHMGKNGFPAKSSRSETGQKTPKSIASPSFSPQYSPSLPSPATTTTATSPVTPTLPIHRFSPLPSPKPPPRHPPPAIPEDQKRHTRQRTDSSEAIMLDDNGQPSPKYDLPLLSFDFDWNHDRTSVAPVH